MDCSSGVKHRSVSVMALILMAVGFLASTPMTGQVEPAARRTTKAPVKGWTLAHTPDGQPDLQGVWTNSTLTPLERPSEFAGKSVLTAEEAAAYEKRIIQKASNARLTATGGPGYDAFWQERATTIAEGLRTSLIVDPPDGRVPALTPEAKKAEDARAQYHEQHPADGPEDLDLSARCIMRLDSSTNHEGTRSGVPMLPDGYNSNVQILQTPGYVVLYQERIHDVRVIPLDGRPHLPPAVRTYLGDPRGHWEGNTLVVDSTNFNEEYDFRGSGPHLHLIERFTRVDANTINYEFTIDDPTTFTKPWTARIPLKAIPGPIYEYACHEGNYAMTDTLKGARLAEKKAAEEAAAPKGK